MRSRLGHVFSTLMSKWMAEAGFDKSMNDYLYKLCILGKHKLTLVFLCLCLPSSKFNTPPASRHYSN